MTGPGTPGVPSVSRVTSGGPALGAAPVSVRTSRRPTRRPADSHRLFSAAIALSAARCLLSYVVLPVAAPIAGVTASAAPVIGIPVAGLALGFDVRAIRRVWTARHRWRWPMTLLYLSLMGLVAELLVRDIARLAS